MGSKICMNEMCRVTATTEWRKGWGLKSRGVATLCYSCGSAYENQVFCEKFHLEESGWRECKLCGKRIHCGCIASKHLHSYLDYGGVGCMSCTRGPDAQLQLIRTIQIPNNDKSNRFGTMGADGVRQSSVLENRVDRNGVDEGKLMQLSKIIDGSGYIPQSQKGEINLSLGQSKEVGMHPFRQDRTGFPNSNPQSVGSSVFVKLDNNKPTLGLKDMYDSLARPSLSFSLGTPLRPSTSLLPIPGGIVEGRDQNKVPPFQQGQRARHILPKPPKNGFSIGSEVNKTVVSQKRVARPPAEGRGRNQLLPRYWPRVTDQELQQISGDLNSTIVPLFEKVLSASDAGRIGRLVLPKACAEAYFPPISQSDGIPIRIQDVKGKEWTFQFRFWPNNNSRMYVLEGVTPCIQNMQLQAGDTVTFSRIDPGGKLVMGFRKATSPVDMQSGQEVSLPNGGLHRYSSFAGVDENLPTKCGGKSNEESLQTPMLIPEKKKKTRNIGSKNKRLHMHSDDAMELRITWEEAQDLLRPSPTSKPNIVMVEDTEFEEYEEPPVFGKKTVFTSRASGEQEQWAQCDSCFKWRRLPMNVLLPPKWTCSENVQDSYRCSCAAPDEINPMELEILFRVSKDSKRQRISESSKVACEREPSGLEALAIAAVLGHDASESGDLSVGATTKHPRHRAGCTCIVCIQPPSGKGKHKPTCMCNVCLTVKRRFKTLMLRKKKRQSEREEIAQGKGQISHKDGAEMDAAYLTQMNYMETESSPCGTEMEIAESSKGRLDLNCHPNREDDMLAEAVGMSLTSLVNAASLPLDMFLRENGLAALGSSSPSKAAEESERRPTEEYCLAPVKVEQENQSDED